MPVSERSHAPDVQLRQFAADARHYLTQSPRQMASRYFYDALGSALFDAICELPWYRITRAETGLLARYGSAILARAGRPPRILELGAGSGAKLAVLAGSRGASAPAVELHLIDISPTALDSAVRALGTLPNVDVVAHHATYESGLRLVARAERPAGRTLALFLGSNIGNFDPEEGDRLLARLRAALAPGDMLLIGTDLVKPEADFQLAYDDPLGVTAAFNRNLFARMNRELGANFDLHHLRHVVVWNEAQSRVEMHVESTTAQSIRIPAAALTFELAAGERIWTENSHKYRPDDVDRMLDRAGFRRCERWLELEAQFALTLAEAVTPTSD